MLGTLTFSIGHIPHLLPSCWAHLIFVTLHDGHFYVRLSVRRSSIVEKHRTSVNDAKQEGIFRQNPEFLHVVIKTVCVIYLFVCLIACLPDYLFVSLFACLFICFSLFSLFSLFSFFFFICTFECTSYEGR